MKIELTYRQGQEKFLSELLYYAQEYINNEQPKRKHSSPVGYPSLTDEKYTVAIYHTASGTVMVKLKRDR